MYYGGFLSLEVEVSMYNRTVGRLKKEGGKYIKTLKHDGFASITADAYPSHH